MHHAPTSFCSKPVLEFNTEEVDGEDKDVVYDATNDVICPIQSGNIMLNMTLPMYEYAEPYLIVFVEIIEGSVGMLL